ncbi:MAG TPA: 50S ribosomal protein L17 [Patescibacteria group bacterium]
MNKSSFGRKRDQRDILLRNLATSVILYESVVTTEAKGRTVQPLVERLIRIAQKEDKLSARRELMTYIFDEKAIHKLFEEITPRYTDRTSGFTRRFRLPARPGDGAARMVVQLTKSVRFEEPVTAKASKEEKKVAPSETKEVTTEGESHE